MVKRTLSEKLAILADAAKYDASCASSGGEKRNSRDGKGLGSSGGSGICHAYAPDGRCISLLKILMTNFCIYDCAYCVNRVSSDVARARFAVGEVVQLTLDFYRRNYIEAEIQSLARGAASASALHRPARQRQGEAATQT
jgi:predicted DNA-binding helix-hairpin-helix protein